MRPLLAVAHALDEHLLQSLVSAAHATAVDGRAPGAGHQPRPPGVVRGSGKRVAFGVRDRSVLRCTGKSGRLLNTRKRVRAVKDGLGGLSPGLAAPPPAPPTSGRKTPPV